MRRLSSLIAVLSVAAISFAAACRSDDNNTPVDGHTGSNGSGSNSTTTVKDVQNDSMAPGTAVTLNGVVVTAIDNFGDKTGDMWVEDMGGGKRSGVHVFKASASGVAVGDVVNVSNAIKSEFALTGSNADNTGRTTTELEPPDSGSTVTITKTGATATITPDKVDALAIGQLYDSTMAATGGGSAFSNAWEDWEGVLVELDNVTAASVAKGFGAKPYASDAYSVNITGVAKLEGTMTDITMSSIALGTCFGKVTGVVDYFYDYLVLPRTAADFNTTGTSCPAVESAVGSSGTVCTDGHDNDGNGFTDCNDLGCETGANAWLGATCTSADATCGCSKNLLTATSALTMNSSFATTGGAAYLHDVYVTGIDTASRGYWISDSLTQTAGHGAFVFTNAAVDTAIVPGKHLTTVQGIAAPFNLASSGQSIIELSNPTAVVDTAAAGTLVPLVGVAPDTLSNLATGGQYVGLLATVGPVKVSTIAAHNQVTLTGTGNKTIVMDDDAFFGYGAGSGTATPPAATSCVTVTGVMNLDTADQIRTINPRSAADIVTTTGCP